MSQEVCRIIITREDNGLVNVSAPMQYKALCYDILNDAKSVIDYTADRFFFLPVNTKLVSLLITMNMTGLVDVQAPLPPREWCTEMLTKSRLIIEQFDAPEQKVRPAGYADCLPSPT